MKLMKVSLSLAAIVLLNGCGGFGLSNSGKHLLPQGGPTTAELMASTEQHRESVYGANASPNGGAIQGKKILPDYQPQNSYSNAHLAELQRDFQLIPNPQITAYVYPHLADGTLPVPGYYTVFRLYNTEHYALSGEGYHVLQ